MFESRQKHIENEKSAQTLHGVEKSIPYDIVCLLLGSNREEFESEISPTNLVIRYAHKSLT